MKMTYREQLLHPNWQRKRLEVLQHYGFSCSECGAEDKTLHVHHRQYVKGRMAWEYPLDELTVLCHECHELEHQRKGLLSEVLAAAEQEGYGPDFVAGLIGGYLSCVLLLDEELERRVADATGPYFITGQVAEMLDHLPYHKLAKLVVENVPSLNPAEERAVRFLERFGRPEGQAEL